jgi:hypothetical protein
VQAIPDAPGSTPGSDTAPAVGGLIDMADRSRGGDGVSGRRRDTPTRSGSPSQRRGAQDGGDSAAGGGSSGGGSGSSGGWRENADGGRTYTVRDGAATREIRVPDGVFGALPEAGAAARVEVLGASEEGGSGGASGERSGEQPGQVTRVLARPLAAIDEVTGGRFDPRVVLAALAAMVIGLVAVIRRELPRW